MKKRIGLTFAVGIMASVASLQAAPTCVGITNVQALINLGSAGCTIDDKTFSSFSYFPLGAGAPSAASVGAILVASVPTLTFGWDIGTPSDAFAGNFLFTFIVSDIASPTCPATICPITASATQMFPTAAPGTQSMVIAYSGGLPSTTLNNVTAAGNGPAGPTISPGVTTLTESIAGFATAANPIFDFSVRLSESPVPEPATYVLTGAGLLGLGLLRHRRTSKS